MYEKVGVLKIYEDGRMIVFLFVIGEFEFVEFNVSNGSCVFFLVIENLSSVCFFF